MHASTLSNNLSSNEINKQIAILNEQGFVVVRTWIHPTDCLALRQAAEIQLKTSPHHQTAPIEFEPGKAARIIRRLLDAYQRDIIFRHWAQSSRIRDWMQTYFGETPVLSRAHHNCIMTKHPGHGITGWHRDSRYWSFERDDLVSVWLALGMEQAQNGALWFIPGSHKRLFSPSCFDYLQYFRTDLASNQALIRTAVSPELNAGDVIFFHCNTLHSAQQNLTETVKLSVVFTYHGISNSPQLGTRSQSKPEVSL